MKAWHFLHDSRRLAVYNDDGAASYTGPIVKPGDVHTAPDGPIQLCAHGMHGSVKPIDALAYAPGAIVCRVDIRGEVVRGGNKCAGREREVLWMADATECLRKFARLCALDVIHLWDPPEIVVRYLKTGDESIRDAAEGAVWAAARAASWAASWAAARAAARAAAEAAAEAAARAAARDDTAEGAVWAAARDAAWAAARDAAWAATGGATGDAVWAAARDKQGRRLTRMLAAVKGEK